MEIDSIGKAALLLALADLNSRARMLADLDRAGYRACAGQVGSMDLQKVVAAIETASRREGLTRPEYPEDHALWHAVLDALQGVGRGQLALGTVLRTVGLRFSVVRGPKAPSLSEQGDWVAVALYGNIGGPIKGNEHEVVGLGISHV
ncbi:MAG: HutP family protein [Bacillota bacterium]